MFDWITSVLDATGALGVGFLMLLENVFPPIPSELVMPLAGFVAARGEVGLVAVILAGSVGSLLGALLWYYLGRALGHDRLRSLAARHGRWLTLAPEEVDRAEAWFLRHGGAAVFLGRLVPGVRMLISVPAGVARMPLPRFLAWSAAGTVIWTAALAGAGFLLEGRYELVGHWVNPVSNVVVVGLVALYIWRVATFGRRRAARGRP
jgi:membrane protein DedA with SNARE-associated domain